MAGPRPEAGQSGVGAAGPDPPEIVGFGALNVDYIASASRLSQRMAERITESVARFEWNREGPVDEEVINDAIAHLGVASLGYSLGGSAWLTIFALAQMGVSLRLGYVGVVGRVEAPGLSFLRQMAELRIDHRWVSRRPDRLSGLCLSYIDDTDRVMLTHPGANFEMCGFIRENLDELARYLAAARVVHVTSFLDEETPVQVLEVLTLAKRLNPKLCLSFDPGFDWAEHPSAAVEGILRLTDLLFVNYREFKALGRYVYGEPDDQIARKTLARCGSDCTVFVTKRYDVIEVFRSVPAGVLTSRFQLQRPVRETELEDATGAGDVFAAGVLSALASRRLQVELGAFVGLSLARQKELHRHSVGERPGLPDLSKGFLQKTERLGGTGPGPPGVFIAHDEHPQWRVVRLFIEQNCGLPTYELKSSDLDGHNLAALMRQSLARCSFAVCLLSAKGSGPGARSPANQNIVHQAGIFQGRYGFGRVAIWPRRAAIRSRTSRA
ncbi:PfkB family carbohydrate kinase [Micromonospora sp. WMMD1102]|uniref:PfkB family carbohydrate kinase n=1 Tax=Micromonospora sp. WMMD1102 TaxID=3016105 RepID=UPI00241561EC|nr:PfkB family carbohydrate kinase [Micromonospora sp. WMMD1102]MDG4788520.1 PfkB family carbohydrate kinase [Micromonospora sp. WMMD1102]